MLFASLGSGCQGVGRCIPGGARPQSQKGHPDSGQAGPRARPSGPLSRWLRVGIVSARRLPSRIAMFALLALVLSAPAAPPPLAVERVSGGHLSIDLDTAPVANLTYQLDCLAALMPCSTGAYRALWKEKLTGRTRTSAPCRSGPSSRVNTRYRSGRAALPAPSPFPLDVASIDLGIRLPNRRAGLENMVQYRRAVRLLVSPADADRLRGPGRAGTLYRGTSSSAPVAAHACWGRLLAGGDRRALPGGWTGADQFGGRV